jgi:hypothetical protein
MKGVTDIFISKEKLAIFWFLIAMGTITYTGWHLHGLTISSRGSIVYVPTQDAYFYLDDFAQDQENLSGQLSELVDFHTRFTLETYLNRAPKGLVTPQRLALLFSDAGFAEAIKEIQSTSYDFKNQQAHQMVEVGKVDIILNTDGTAYSIANGQVVRVSIDPTTKELITQSFLVNAEMNWARNPNLRYSRRFPYVCTSIDYSLRPIAAPEEDSDDQK